MSDPGYLAAEIDGFARIVEDIHAIAGRHDPGRRGELIALRRQLAERIARVRERGLQAFTDPALSNDFRSRLSQVLNLMALHQAKWPAVSIDSDEIAYRTSAQQLTDANRAFIAWTRAALARTG